MSFDIIDRKVLVKTKTIKKAARRKKIEQKLTLITMCFNLYIYLLNVNVCKYTLIHDVEIYRYIYRDIDIVNIFQIYSYLNSGFFGGEICCCPLYFYNLRNTHIYIYIYLYH